MPRRDTGPDKSTRELVAERDGWHCVRCGSSVDPWPGFQFHHRRPRGMGGSRDEQTNLPSNLLLLCSGCHLWVESNRNAADAHGFLVDHAVTRRKRISEIPVEHARHGWVTLGDDGSVTPYHVAPTEPRPEPEWPPPGFHLDVEATKAGKWRWRFVASNGRTMADSGQGYSRRVDCLNGCATVLGGEVDKVAPESIFRVRWDLEATGSEDEYEDIPVVDLTREAKP